MPLEQRWTLLNQSWINIQRILSRSISIIKVIRKKSYVLETRQWNQHPTTQRHLLEMFYLYTLQIVSRNSWFFSFVHFGAGRKEVLCFNLFSISRNQDFFPVFFLKVWEQNKIIGFFLLYEFLSLPTNLYNGNDCQLFFLFDCFYLDLRLICGDFYNVGLIK